MEKNIENLLTLFSESLSGAGLVPSTRKEVSEASINALVRRIIAEIERKKSTAIAGWHDKPCRKPVCSYLPVILENLTEPKQFPRMLIEMQDQLEWKYGYPEHTLPGELSENYAYTEILGPEGLVHSKEVIAGVILLGPHCDYPAHKHNNIEEIYLAIHGKVYINQESLPAGYLKFIDQFGVHELKTSGEPALILFAWHGEEEVIRNKDQHFRFV